MKKAIIHAAVTGALAAMGLSAQAALVAPTTTNYASEIFGTGATGTSGTTLAGLPVLTYQFDGGRTAAAGLFQYQVTLSGSTFAVAVTAGTLEGSAVTALTAGCTAPTVSVRSGGTVGSNTVTFDVTPTNDCIAGSKLTFSIPNLKSTVGGAISATVKTSDLYGEFDATTTRTQTIATVTASLAVTATASVDGAAPALGKIDAIAQGGKFFVNGSTTGTKVTKLGTLTWTDTTTGVTALGTTNRAKVAGDKISFNLSGDFSAAVGVASSGGVFLSSAVDCSIKTIYPTTISSTAVTFTNVAGTTLATSLCMEVDGTTVIPATTVNVSGTYTPAITTEKPTTLASTPMMALSLNAKQADVISYIPKATAGYVSFVRIANTGTPAAVIKGQFLKADGTVTAEATLVTSLAAGASTTLDSTAIEAALGGSLAAADRPRLRITAASSGLEVQSYMSNPDGSVSNLTSVITK